MKKWIWYIIAFIFLMPIYTNADTVNYKIKNYYINADILENGNLEVTELIVLKGSFNGYIREIVYKNPKLGTSGYESNAIYNATGIEIENIAAKKVDNVTFDTLKDTDFVTLKEGKAANLGYLVSDIANGFSYKMYFKSEKEQVAFRIKYIVKDVVVLHQDVGELYFTFIGEEYSDAINDLQIKLNLPSKDTSGLFKVWAHGDMAGEIQPYDNQYLLATVKKLNAYSPVDIRATFSKNLVDENKVSKKTNEEALDKIVMVETKRADVANKDRFRMKLFYYSILISSIVHLLSLLIAWIFIYHKFDKEYKSSFNLKYNREFIDEYNVEVVDYLMHKNITPNALSASILNLIYKKNIKAEKMPTKSGKMEYDFVLQNEENLNATEKQLIDFLFNKIGKENRFSTIELRAYAEQSYTCEEFSANYTAWKKSVLNDAKKQNFFENNVPAKVTGILFLFFSVLLTVLKNRLNVILPFTKINVIVSVIFFIYTLSFFKRTKKGNEDYAKWKAFKNFLNDFGTFDTKELPEIALWERYMVYATVFGLADKVSKAMNVKIKELASSDIDIEVSNTFSDYHFFNSFNHIVHSAVQSNTTAITESRASSSYSSGSGGGGGFSSGGGFGGGGGGGHGF